MTCPASRAWADLRQTPVRIRIAGFTRCTAQVPGQPRSLLRTACRWDMPAATLQLRACDLPRQRKDTRLIAGLGDEQDQREDDDLRSASPCAG